MTANDILIKVLHTLESGQPLSVNQIARAIRAPHDIVWPAIEVLLQQGLVTLVNGHIQISRAGRLHVQNDGFRGPGNAGLAYSSQPGVKQASPFAALSKGNLPIITIIACSLVVLFCCIACLASLIPIWSTTADLLVLFLAAILVFLYAWKCVRVVPAYERLVIFRMGQCAGERGPGPVYLIPLLDRVVKVDIRIHTLKIPREKCLTKDNLLIDADMVLYWWVQQPEWSITRIANLDDSLHLLATALLHDIIIQYRSSEVQLQREQINELLRNKIEKTSSAWGIFTDVEIRDIKPPAEIITLMQLQAAAEWKRQITVAEAEGYRDAQKVKAEGDAAALEKLNQAAAKVDEKMLVIRHLETLHELGKSAATKFILPVELIDLVRPIANKLRWEEVPIPDNRPNRPSKDGQSGE